MAIGVNLGAVQSQGFWSPGSKTFGFSNKRGVYRDAQSQSSSRSASPVVYEVADSMKTSSVEQLPANGEFENMYFGPRNERPVTVRVNEQVANTPNPVNAQSSQDDSGAGMGAEFWARINQEQSLADDAVRLQDSGNRGNDTPDQAFIGGNKRMHDIFVWVNTHRTKSVFIIALTCAGIYGIKKLYNRLKKGEKIEPETRQNLVN